MRASIVLLNPRPHPEHSMSKHKNSRRARRRNPSGKAAMVAGGHTMAKAVAGTVATLVVRKVLQMKKPDGTARFTPKTALAIQGGAAFAAAVGSSMVDNKMVGDVLEGTALVMGGDAGLQAATLYQIPERVQALIPGQPAAPQLNAPAQTAPGGWVGMTGVSSSNYVS